LTPGVASFGPNVHEPVGTFYDLDLMFDDEQGISNSFQRIESPHERFGVGWMQTGGGLIEYVDNAEEIRMELCREAQAL
jgi:hypothetical protein